MLGHKAESSMGMIPVTLVAEAVTMCVYTHKNFHFELFSCDLRSIMVSKGELVFQKMKLPGVSTTCFYRL
jgi:hypothetical protein